MPRLRERKHIPGATYRLQFSRQFTFAQAEKIIPYLRELGISDCYASPLFEAATESTHGYDVCSFGDLNSSVGSARDFDNFIRALHGSGLRLMLDVVPNHMAASLSNPWWRDVLEHGRASKYSEFFDIDWEPPNPAFHGKVLLPVLEDDYAKVIQGGKIRLKVCNEKFVIAYYESAFPVALETLRADAASVTERTLKEHDPSEGADALARLDALIRRQYYVLAHWKEAAKRINYRRFFDVAGLVSLRMELPEVFAATHALLMKLVRAGNVAALRIDHPDGLWDPRQYFDRLQAAVKNAKGGPDGIYVVSEKILSDGETLPGDWPLDGTTGYDFLNRVNGLFVNTANESALTRLYREFTACDTDFRAVVHDCKRQIVEASFTAEVEALTNLLCELAKNSPAQNLSVENIRTALVEIIAAFPVYRTYITETTIQPSDADQASIEQALNVACAKNSSLNAAAVDFIGGLLLLDFDSGLKPKNATLARRFIMRFQQLTGPAMAKGLEDTAFYRFNRLISLNEVGGNPGNFGVSIDEFHKANSRNATHWPNTLLATATHDTKRGEDARARLDVLSEMPEEWRDAVLRWRGLNNGKKALVNGQPAPSANDEYLLYQSLVGACPFHLENPGVLRSFRERVSAFMLKAVKETKVNTSWLDPNPAYENAVREFIEQVLAESGKNLFLDEVRNFSEQLAFFGAVNSLAQTLLKITSPGVPDFYQGTELWDLSFVDPDNRRPVDYKQQTRLLTDLKNRFRQCKDDPKRLGSELLTDIPSGQIKMFVTWRALGLRQRLAELFREGEYIPLHASGLRCDHVCAFARVHQNEVIVTIVPRLIHGLTGGRRELPIGREIWSDTILELPRSLHRYSFRNAFSGELVEAVDPEQSRALELGRVFQSFPLALLHSGKSV